MITRCIMKKNEGFMMILLFNLWVWSKKFKEDAINLYKVGLIRTTDSCSLIKYLLVKKPTFSISFRFSAAKQKLNRKIMQELYKDLLFSFGSKLFVLLLKAL